MDGLRISSHMLDEEHLLVIVEMENRGERTPLSRLEVHRDKYYELMAVLKPVHISEPMHNTIFGYPSREDEDEALYWNQQRRLR